MRQLLIPALILVVVAGAAVGFQENSQGQLKRPANEGLARAVDDLQKKLQSLRADVDYLLVPEKYNQEETGYLETLVRSREAIYKRILLGWKAGMKPTYDEALARYHLSAARAQLEWAKGEMGRCQKEWEAAILAAKKQLEVMRFSYEAGQLGLNRVIEAQAQLADAQLNLSRMKRKSAWKQDRPGQDNSQGQLKRPANERLAHVVDDLRKELQSLRADVDYLLVPEKYNQEEIGYLEALVRSREPIYKRIHTEWEVGTKSTYDEVLARYHLHAARAHLAWAKGDVGRCQKEWEAAISAAERLVKVVRISYEVGKVGLNRVIEAQAQLTDAKLKLSRMKRKSAWKQDRPDQDNSQGQLKRPANQRLADVVDDLQKELQSLRADVDYLLVPEKYNQEETGYLETLVRSREAIYKKILPDRKAGMKPTYDEALARYHLHAARAHLAWAKGDVGRCQKEWEPAILVAKTQLEVMRVSYEAGRVGLNRVREAQAQLADAQLNLSKIKRKIAWKQNRR